MEYTTRSPQLNTPEQYKKALDKEFDFLRRTTRIAYMASANNCEIKIEFYRNYYKIHVSHNFPKVNLERE